DLLREGALAARCGAQRCSPGKPVMVSALTGQGLEDLREAIEKRLASGRIIFDIALDPANGAGLHWLYENTEVMRKSTAADGAIHVRVRVVPERAEPVRRKFPAAGPQA
ncbi:MAG: GTPase HflX, partial [Methylocella sp.]